MSEKTVRIRKAAKDRLRIAARRRGAHPDLQEMTEQEVAYLDKQQDEKRAERLASAKSVLESLATVTDEQWQAKADAINASLVTQHNQDIATLEEELAELIGDRDDIVRWGELHPDDETQSVVVHALESADHDINEAKEWLESAKNNPPTLVHPDVVKLAALVAAADEVEQWKAPVERQPLTKNRRKWAKFHRSLADS